MPMSRVRAPLPLPTVTYAPASSYAGVWRSGETYQPGQFATHKGALWHCDSAQAGKPGTPGSGWRMAAKSGSEVKL